MALDINSGKILWVRQMTADDAYTSACRLPDRTNCPDVNGPDFDFGASPILVNLKNGKRALIAGQKSGVVHALDPDKQGETLWEVRVGKGGTMGAVADRTAGGLESAGRYLQEEGLSGMADDITDMIRENLIAERIAVDHYRELIRFFGNNDPATRTMLESILSKEEEHANDMLDLLAAHGK